VTQPAPRHPDAPPPLGDDWAVYGACHTAAAILGHRQDESARRDAYRALLGWNLTEIAAGRRGPCPCGGPSPCRDCGPRLAGQGVG